MKHGFGEQKFSKQNSNRQRVELLNNENYYLLEIIYYFAST